MKLTIRSGPDAGKTVEIVGDQFTVGRDASVDLTIQDAKVSRRHAYFKPLPDGGAALHDLGSSNGTFVNGHKVQSASLSGGEEVQFGDTVLSVAREGAAPAVAPAAAQPAAPAPTPPAPAPPGGFTPPTQPLPPAQAPQPQAPVPPRAPAATPVGGPARTQSAIQRIMIQRSARRATIIGVAAIVVAVAVAVLFGTGVLPVDDGDDAASARPVRDIVREVTPSTVFIQAFDPTGSGGAGTGWVYDAEEGLVVTNAHVVTDLLTFSTLPDVSVSLGTEDDEREAEVVSNAICADLAMLEVDENEDMRTLPLLEDQDQLAEGDDVVAVGYPGTGSEATQLVTTTGVVSVVETTFDEVGTEDPMRYPNVIQTSTPINPGNSGGPLVTRPTGDEPAALAGVNTLVRTSDPLSQRDIQGQNYAIGVDRVKELLPDMADGENVCPDLQDDALPEGIPGAPSPLPIPGEEFTP